MIEYKRKQNNGIIPRMPGDVPGGCNELPIFGILETIVIQRSENDIFKEWYNCYRVINHIQAVMLRYTYTYEYNESENNLVSRTVIIHRF